MHHYSQHSLVDEHEDGIRIHDWVAQQYPMSQGIEQGKLHKPTLDTVNDDEDRFLKDETDVESDYSQLELPPMTFRISGDSYESSSESETQNLGTEKPLPLPPSSDSLAYHSPSPSVSAPTAELSRSRKPSLVSLSGYHLPSSVQVIASPRPSLVSLSRQSSLNGHFPHLGVPHSRQPSLNRQPSLPLLSPSSSITLSEEDDKLEIYAKCPSQEGVNNTVIAHKRSPSKANSLSRDETNIHILSRSGSGSSGSSSSLRRLSSVRSCQSIMGSLNDRRAYPRHSSAGNTSNSVPYPATRRHHLHSPSLPSLLTSTPTPSMSCHITDSSHVTSPSFDDGDSQVTHQYTLDSSPVSTSLSTPPPTATFGPSSSISGVAAETTNVATLRNRDAVYIDAFDSAEVQRRLAELLIASGTASVVGGDAHFSERNKGQIIESSDDFVHSGREPCQPMSSQTELPSQSLTSHKGYVLKSPKEEQSHWSPSSSNEHLPLSPTTVSSGQSDTIAKLPATSDSYSYGVGFGTVPLMAIGIMGGGVPSNARNPKPKKRKADTEKKKRKSLMGGKDNSNSGKSDYIADNADGRVDDGATTKPPRQRFVSLIARAIGSGNGTNSTNSASSPVSPVLSPTSANPTSSGSGSTPHPGITLGLETASSHHEPLSSSRSRSDSMISHQEIPVSSTGISSAPTLSNMPSELTPHIVPFTRMRSSSNASRASPLRIEVLPYAPCPATAVTPAPAASTPTSASRGRSISITGGLTTPLPPPITPGRMRSESQTSEISNISWSSTSGNVFTPMSPPSASLSLMPDRFLPPKDARGGSELIEEDEKICERFEEASDEEARSDVSDMEDDGAYYVKSFERSFGDKNRLRSPKSREFEDRDDGDTTETEEMVRDLSPKSTKPSSRHLSRPSSGTLSSKPILLPISPPPSIEPSPISPVQMTQTTTDLLDSDPFAATSLTLITGRNTTTPTVYFQDHPSPFLVPSIETRRDTSSNFPYISRSAYASKSASTLHKAESTNPPTSSPYSKAKSLMSPGDLPKPRKQVNIPALSMANSNTQTTTSGSKSSPTSPLRGDRSQLSPPNSPTFPRSRTPTKSGSRMSVVSGMISRFTFGNLANRTREMPAAIPLPPPTPGEGVEANTTYFSPPLPTPVTTPTIEAAKLPLPLEKQLTTPFSELEVGVEPDGDVDDGDDSMYEPPSPTTPSSPHVDASSRRGSGGSRLSLSYIRAKRYLLVVNGAGLSGERPFESVKEWCKNLGEVRRCTRKPNGDLHLEFKRGSIPDALCRNQTINIEGAGSVNLSWHRGKDKTAKSSNVAARV
ncbi:hypothetical protein E1B28_002781 [Marasmius oreades]|uniref:Uncharacterized protein n=1 Tax=Marasmius oreades TaxID=181124 RepID=A0A9P7RPC2_9AGAR|nr:uncharacterized protein E1B28_002781 [Marasmius oreades]KAG7086860.1 hypothetical protein E1B28_002781 [Marasmius oreades]